MKQDNDLAQRWTRWHSDGWTLQVEQTTAGDYYYRVRRDDIDDGRLPASSKIDAQHQAEDIVRRSGHRCVARCSFWVPDTPEELD